MVYTFNKSFVMGMHIAMLKLLYLDMETNENMKSDNLN